VFIPFTAQTRMSGVDIDERELRKGASDAISKYVVAHGGEFPAAVQAKVNEVAKKAARRSSSPSAPRCSVSSS